MELTSLNIAIGLDLGGLNAGLSQIDGQLEALELSFRQWGAALGRDLNGLENPLDTVADGLGRIVPAASESQSALGRFAGEVGETLEVVKGKWREFGDWLEAQWDREESSLATALEQMENDFAGAGSLAEETAEKIKSLYGDLSHSGSRALASLQSSLTECIAGVMRGQGELKDFFKSLWDDILRIVAQALAKMVAMAIVNRLAMQAAMGGEGGIASAASSAIAGAGSGGGVGLSTSQALGMGAAGVGGYFVGKAIGGSSGGSYGASLAMVGMMVGGPVGAAIGAVVGGLIGRNSGHNTESEWRVEYKGGQVADPAVNIPSSTLESTQFKYTQPDSNSVTIDSPQIVIQAQDIGGPTERKRIAGELWKEIKRVAANDNRRFGASMVTG